MRGASAFKRARTAYTLQKWFEFEAMVMSRDGLAHHVWLILEV
jgi:hypothetical protein